MAILTNLQTQSCVILQVHHLFGRHSTSNSTQLKNSEASRLHAIISWCGERWTLKDSSVNGTFLNGQKLSSDSSRVLTMGDKINFGCLQSDSWELEDVSEPKNMLIPISPGLDTIELKTFVVLPSEEQPEITLYLNEEGQWICESGSGSSPLSSGDLVGANQSIWRFVESKPTEVTQSLTDAPAVKAVKIAFAFEVSQNEEHISLVLSVEDVEVNLGTRSHHYLLLVLARQRLVDKEQGLKAGEQGWLNKDVLCKMLGLSENHINIQIYRFRKQVVSAMDGAPSFVQFIQRRTGEIRFAVESIKINGGAVQNTDSERLETLMIKG